MTTTNVVTISETGPREQCDVCMGWTEKEEIVGRIEGEGILGTIVCIDCIDAGPEAIPARILESTEGLEAWARRRRVVAAEEEWVMPSREEIDAYHAERDAERQRQFEAYEDAYGHPHHGCPECPPKRGPDNVYNAGKTHRGACHEHRTSWLIGVNLFTWPEETEEEQREQYREIEDYTDVSQSEPLRPDADEAEVDIPF